MAPKAYKVGAAASKLGVHVNTVRLWCDRYAAHLSPSANPPSPQVRKLTDADLAVLAMVRDWRAGGRSLAAIGEELDAGGELPPAGVVVDALQPGQGVQDGRSGELVTAAVVDAMRSEFAALQARLAETGAQVQAAHAKGFALGFTMAVATLIGLLFVVGLLLWLVGAL